MEMEETILISDSGTVFIREKLNLVFLGLASGRRAAPDVLIELTKLQRKKLVEALLCAEPEPEALL